MSDHHRSSYYKDSYSSSSKRYHSPGEGTRMGLSAADYFDSSERSKRSRTDSYGAHTSSTRYADYSASSSSGSGSRYKTASYYDLPGYKPATSSTSSKYLEEYKGSGSSRSAPKSNVRRVPPPLTPPSLSSKSSPSIRLQPLMKVSLSSSNSGGGSGSGKDYYGSRMRQAPPEHHHSYSGSHGTSTYGKSDFKRPGNYSSSKSIMSTGYHPASRAHVGPVSYRSSTIASRRLIARSRVPPSVGLNSRMRGRAALAPRRDDDFRRRKNIASKRDMRRSRSRSRTDERELKGSSSDKKDPEESEKSPIKKIPNDDDIDFASMAEGQVVVEEVAGDDDEDGDQDSSCNLGNSNSGMDNTGLQPTDDKHSEDQSSSSKHELKTEVKNDSIEGKTCAEKGSDEKEKPHVARALLKLHCPYCDVRCISFREFTFHLRSSSHTRTMSSAVSEMKKKLAKIRQEMKEDQRKREKAEKVLSDTSSFCRVCELSFRTDPKEHEANEIHNKIKALIYRRCDVCDIDFRIWKVHIYHMAALEHAKRVAMKELQEGEAKGDNVKGTNLSPDELGLDLVEVRTVFYCNACIRYIPIKGQSDEAKTNHCMTLNHLKSVEEFNEKERRRAQREEARERAKRRKIEETEKANKVKACAETNEVDKSSCENEHNENVEVDNSNIVTDDSAIQIKQEPVDISLADVKDEFVAEDTGENCESDIKDVGSQQGGEGQVTSVRHEAEEDDDDEIELHAGEDDVEDESEDTGDWNRRTRSTQRGDGSSK